jgi:hypothetical protein
MQFQGRAEKSVSILISWGIVGHTGTTGEVANILAV